MEILLTKLMLIAVLVSVTPIIIKVLGYLLLRRLTKEKAYENMTKEKIKALKDKKLKQQMELEDILKKSELSIYHNQARTCFHDAIQARNLDREQILYLKKVINEALGDFINDYKYKKYTNDAHEIYDKISSSHISIPDFKKIIQLIKTFEAINQGQYLTVLEDKMF